MAVKQPQDLRRSVFRGKWVRGFKTVWRLSQRQRDHEMSGRSPKLWREKKQFRSTRKGIYMTASVNCECKFLKIINLYLFSRTPFYIWMAKLEEKGALDWVFDIVLLTCYAIDFQNYFELFYRSIFFFSIFLIIMHLFDLSQQDNLEKKNPFISNTVHNKVLRQYFPHAYERISTVVLM